MLIYAVFLLPIAIGTTGGALVSSPTDQNVTVGQQVILLCATNLDLPVYWFFKGNEIFYGGKVAMSFQDRYDVISNKTGEYNLVIPSADVSYNGEYICGDDEGEGERKSAHLYVTGEAAVTEAGTPDATLSDKNNQTLIIGVVVGSFAVLLIAVLIAVVVCLCRRRGSRNRGTRDQDTEQQLQPIIGNRGTSSRDQETEQQPTGNGRTSSEDQETEQQQPMGNGRTSSEDQETEQQQPTERVQDIGGLITFFQEKIQENQNDMKSPKTTAAVNNLERKADAKVTEPQQKISTYKPAAKKPLDIEGQNGEEVPLLESEQDTTPCNDSTATPGGSGVSSAKDGSSVDSTEKNDSETTRECTGVDFTKTGSSHPCTSNNESITASDYSEAANKNSVVDSSKAGSSADGTEQHSSYSTAAIVPKAEEPHREGPTGQEKPPVGPKPKT